MRLELVGFICLISLSGSAQTYQLPNTSLPTGSPQIPVKTNPLYNLAKGLFITLLIGVICSNAKAQVIPDLTTGDHFLPYMNEGRKQEQIIKRYEDNIRKKYPQTSEELYPHLYKYTDKDYLSPIRGTPADPANAIQNYSTNTFQKPATNAVVSPNLYNTQLSVQQRNFAEIEADMAAYEARKIESQRLASEALKELERPTINYQLGIHNGAAVDRFANAYSELTKMLDGSQKIDFAKAVWMVENAGDPSVSWEEFNMRLQGDVQIIQQLMVQDKLSPKDNLAKIMAIYKFMADTTSVYMPAKERVIVSKPMLYDFEDFKAEKDITKVFVSKLLRTGSGQCMSLPMLYYLYAKALRADVNIAFAPQHSYITFKDNFGNWQNIELTARMFISTDFHWHSGFIKTEQVKSGIYLTPISEKETIAYLMTTLALTYVKKFGSDNRMLEMASTARHYFPNSLTANMIETGYYLDLWKNVLRQYDVYGLDENTLKNDASAQAIKKKKEELVDRIYKNLGWSKMPEDAYRIWLDGVNELANKRQHLVVKRQLEQQIRK